MHYIHHVIKQSDLAKSISSTYTFLGLGRKHKTRGRLEYDDFGRSNEIILPIKNELDIHLEEERFDIEAKLLDSFKDSS